MPIDIAHLPDPTRPPGRRSVRATVVPSPFTLVLLAEGTDGSQGVGAAEGRYSHGMDTTDVLDRLREKLTAAVRGTNVKLRSFDVDSDSTGAPSVWVWLVPLSQDMSREERDEIRERAQDAVDAATGEVGAYWAYVRFVGEEEP